MVIKVKMIDKKLILFLYPSEVEFLYSKASDGEVTDGGSTDPESASEAVAVIESLPVIMVYVCPATKEGEETRMLE